MFLLAGVCAMSLLALPATAETGLGPADPMEWFDATLVHEGRLARDDAVASHPVPLPPALVPALAALALSAAIKSRRR